MYKKRYWSAALIEGRAFLLNASAKKICPHPDNELHYLNRYTITLQLSHPNPNLSNFLQNVIQRSVIRISNATSI